MPSTQELRRLAMARLTAVGGPLAAPLLILFKNQVVLSPNTLFGDLEEADFAGYTRPAALVFGAPFDNPQGQWEIAAPSVQFTATTNLTPNTIYGWAIITPTGNTLLYAELLSEPVAIVQANDGLTALPRYVWGA